MKRIVLLLSIILFVPILPFAFAHADAKSISISTPYGMIPDDRIIGLSNNKQDDVGVELFTKEWFWQNFSLLLGMGTTLLIVSTMSIAFREEIIRGVKKDKSHAMQMSNM